MLWPLWSCFWTVLHFQFSDNKALFHSTGEKNEDVFIPIKCHFSFRNAIPVEDKTCSSLTEHAQFNFNDVVEQSEDCLIQRLQNCGVLALPDPLGQDVINLKEK